MLRVLPTRVRLIALTVVSIPAAACAHLSGAPVEYQWQFESIGSVRGQVSQALLLPGGEMLVVFCDAVELRHDLYAATRTPAGWHVTLIDAAGGFDFCTALQASGEPMVSYYDEVNARLKFAWRENGAWHTEIVDATPYAGYSGSGVVWLPSGDPAVSYYAAPDGEIGALRYAARRGGPWSITIVDPDVNAGFFSSMALQPSGQPAISYFSGDGRRLMYAVFDGASWQTSAVANDAGIRTCLAFSPAGRPAVAYLGGVVATDLHFTTFDGAHWQDTLLESLIPSPEHWISIPRMTFTPDGRPILAYVTSQRESPIQRTNRVLIQEFAAGAWRRTVVQEGGLLPSSPGFVIIRPGNPGVTFETSGEVLVLGRAAALADLNCDGDLGAADGPHFVQAILDPAGYVRDHDGGINPACTLQLADLNGDGLEDAEDVQLFVARLLAP